MAEFLIIGAGLAGASTAWNFALRGQPVTVLERTTPANALGSSHGGRVIGSANGRDGVVSSENRQLMTDYMKRYLPGLEPAPYAEATCLATNTPTEDFIFDAEDGIVIVSACSGHGAKFAPLLGELAADLAMGAATVPDRFRRSRQTGHE